MVDLYTSAIIKGMSQYTFGVVVGSAMENLIFDMFPVDAANDRHLAAVKVILQAGATGAAAVLGMQIMNGNDAAAAAEDPTGGLLFVYGLLTGQRKWQNDSYALGSLFMKEIQVRTRTATSNRNVNVQVVSSGPVRTAHSTAPPPAEE